MLSCQKVLPHTKKDAPMFTVQMEKECACFKKSEYTNNMTFETQQDAYRYATTVAELMNEEFCGTHIFTAHRGDGDYFLIAVAINPEAVGITPHVSCDVGCTVTDKWSLESNAKSKK
jgi:hypothetical protein